MVIVIPLARQCDSDPNLAAGCTCHQNLCRNCLASCIQTSSASQLRSSHLPQHLLVLCSRGAAALHGTLTFVFVRAGARRSFANASLRGTTIPSLQSSTSIRSNCARVQRPPERGLACRSSLSRRLATLIGDINHRLAWENSVSYTHNSPVGQVPTSTRSQQPRASAKTSALYRDRHHRLLEQRAHRTGPATTRP